MDTILFVRRLLILILLVAFQVLILNRIVLFGYVTPLFYLWMIARFDTAMSRVSMLLWSFFLGLAIDLASGTPGLNASCATLLGMLQPGFVKLFVSTERHEMIVPGTASMGRGFIGYLLLLTGLHHTIYFFLRSIPLGDWTALILKIVFSTLLTLIFMLVTEFLSVTSGRKRS